MTSEDYAVKAYLIDKSQTVLCERCGRQLSVPMEYQITESELLDAFGPGGVYCRECGEEILEPEDLDEDEFNDYIDEDEKAQDEV